MKILIADGSAVMRKIIRQLLENLGYLSVAEASDGAEAVALFKAGQFNLVLTDWSMPNKTGLELIRGVRETGSTVPIIVITTEAETEQIADAISIGATDYVTKPFDQSKLHTILNKHAAAQSDDANTTALDARTRCCESS